MILVLMGVSGVGKTTIGKLLSARTGWMFDDADDYHPEENRRKMAAGIPLNDTDRAPWLKAVHELMLSRRERGQNAILACSALRQEYRDLLTGGFAPDEVRFVYLDGTPALLAERMKLRHHPFMNASLLDSQLATLEVPSDAWRVSVSGSPEDAAEEIFARMRKTALL